MNTILIILAVIACLVVLLLIVALFMKKEHYVNRETIIDAPIQKVFAFLRLVKNQDKFNKWATTDKNRNETFTGTDGTVGFIYSWSGNKNAGIGEKEIKHIIEGERIETEVRFTKPMKVAAVVIMQSQSLPDGKTKVNFINSGTLPYPFNLMIPMAEKNFARDIDESLLKLKSILEE